MRIRYEESPNNLRSGKTVNDRQGLAACVAPRRRPGVSLDGVLEGGRRNSRDIVRAQKTILYMYLDGWVSGAAEHGSPLSSIVCKSGNQAQIARAPVPTRPIG